MALKDTSERYNYIYGNTVRKMDVIDDGYRIPSIDQGNAALQNPYPDRYTVPKAPRRQKKKSRRRGRHNRDFDWKYTVIVSLAFLVITACLIFYVKGTVTLNNLYGQVTELKGEKTRLLSRQAALRSAIDQATNLDEIRIYAVKNLKMVYPGKDKTIYYTDNNSDYIRQYESVDAD